MDILLQSKDVSARIFAVGLNHCARGNSSTFLAAGDYLEAFASDGSLTIDPHGHCVLLHGGPEPGDRHYRAVFTYDEDERCIVEDITHPDGRRILPHDFPVHRGRRA